VKICLINTPWTTVKGYEDSIRVPFPLGLAYIASFLRTKGIEVKIIDALAGGWRIRNSDENGIISVGIEPGKVAEMASVFCPDAVGISCMFTSQSNNLHEMARAIKNKMKEIPVIAGGAHASAAPQRVLLDPSIDFVVQGEGEQTMLDLMRHLEGRIHIWEVKGIHFRQGNGVVFSGQRQPIMDLDSLPMPAYDLLPMKEYFESGEMGLAPRSVTNKRWMSVITSRGCPYMCNFCSVHLVSGRRWRARTPASVLDEIEYLKERYGVKHIFFEDDNLTFDPSRAEALFKGIIEREIDITWETPNGIRADRLTSSLIDVMKKSGCVGLTIAVESGDQKFLHNTIKKNLDLKKLEDAAGIIRKKGIDLSAFFILGIPGETEKTAARTIYFSRKLARKGVRPYFNIAVPLIGTEMYREAEEKGYLQKKEPLPVDYLVAMQKPLLHTADYTPEKLLSWRKRAMLLASIELLFHNPSSLLASETFLRLKREPLSILKNAKILFRGTC
jgi:anaerobic magnesium-protoporphyrin IX monomethyl ester cyclase